MEKELTHLQCSPLIHERKYLEILRFLQQKCESGPTIELTARVQSAKKSLTSEEAFISSIVSHLLQLQTVVGQEERLQDLSRLHRWFVVNKKLLFPTTKTFQKQPPKMGMCPQSTGSQEQTTPPHTAPLTSSIKHKSRAVPTVPATTPVEQGLLDGQDESHDSHVISSALEHHPRWNYSQLSQISSLQFRKTVLDLAEPVGCDLEEEREARREWMSGRRELWTLAQKILPAGSEEEVGTLVEVGAPVEVEVGTGGHAGDDSNRSHEPEEYVKEWVCPSEGDMISRRTREDVGVSCNPTHLAMSVTFKNDHHPPHPEEGKPQLPPINNTKGVSDSYYGNLYLSTKQPKKLRPFVAGFRSER